MSPRSSAGHLPHPHPSGGTPRRGRNKRGHRSGLKEIFRNLKEAFSPPPQPSLDVPPPSNQQMRHDQQTHEIGKAPSRFEIYDKPLGPGNPPGPGGQTRALHQGTQEGYRRDIPEMPLVDNTGYPSHPPPGLGQQVYATPPEVPPAEEIIIALMGVTGAGKSYFIREVSGNSEVVVSDDLYSCTREVRSYPFEFEGAKITLVDTPGFDDTIRSDTDVLRDIADWTSATYRKKQLLSGIIYLHPITHTRMEGSALKNLRMFRNLCGQKVLKNVFLTTTQWSKVDLAQGEDRESKLRNSDFWGGLIDKGATIQRFHGTRESGLELIRGLMPKERKTLDIQDQIVNQGKTLLETDAGQFINEELIALEKKHREEIESLKRACEEAIGARENEITELRAAEEKARRKLEKVVAEKRFLAELHAEEVEKRRKREEAESCDKTDKTVIAVATKDLEFITSGVTSYNTKGFLISDINNDELFNSDPIRVTICYEIINNTDVQVSAKTFLGGRSDAGIGATSYITLGNARYGLKPGIHRTGGGQNFIIFSKASEGGM